MCLLSLSFDFSKDFAFSWTFVFDSLPDNLDCALFSVTPYDLAVWFIGPLMAGRTSFGNEEYADIIFHYGAARGNAEQARREYGEVFPNRRLPDARVFSRTFRRVRERGTVVRYQGDAGRPRLDVADDEEKITLSTRMIARRMGRSQRKTEDLSPSDNVFTNHPQLFTRLFCKNCNLELQHTIVEDQTKVLIARVYSYFECEYEELKKLYGDRDLTPLSKFRQRTALATGVSETTVLQILEEEERRNAEKLEESKRSRALKRSIQTESSSLEDSSDDSVGDGGQPSNAQEAQNEAEIETLVVKLEPECDKEQVQINTDSVQVKAEPPDDDVNDTSESLAVTEPAANKRRRRKSPRKSDVTPTTLRQQTQSESLTAAGSTAAGSTAAGSTAAGSTAADSSNVRLTEELDESDLSEETEIKMEKIEIGEEGFS